ncbi:MAG: outer membrane lipoprotein-sorting protein [Puniceicoccales bacterium]|nr:outer membrane lipoprotein-sorting protein [Puniceicoccales bacterium]
MKNLLRRIVLVLYLLLGAEGAFAVGSCGLHFLPDGESDVFFGKFLRNHNLGDFALRIKLESFSKQCGHSRADGVVLHRQIDGASAYRIEIADEVGNFRKFLLKNGKILTNFSEHFGPNEPFAAGSLYTPNDILLPFLNQNCGFKYSGPRKVCGRVTQQFIVPIDHDLLGPDVKYARVSVDSAFFQALEIEYLDGRQKLLSMQRVLSLCKRNDCWQPKVLELFNVTTRARSKITIVDSDFNPELDDVFFDPSFRLEYSLPPR